MATSGTYVFDPNLADIIDEAWERCGEDPATLQLRQIRAARRSMNYLLSELAGRGIHQWAIESDTQVLTADDASYALDPGTIDVLHMVLRRADIDTEMIQISREDYYAIPVKTQTGRPDRFFIDKGASTKTIYLWPVPENSTDTLVMQRMRQTQDAGSTATLTLEMPYHMKEAFVAGLAARLALKFKTEKFSLLQAAYEAQLNMASKEDRDRSDLTIRIGRR